MQWCCPCLAAFLRLPGAKLTFESHMFCGISRCSDCAHHFSRAQREVRPGCLSILRHVRKLSCFFSSLNIYILYIIICIYAHTYIDILMMQAKTWSYTSQFASHSFVCQQDLLPWEKSGQSGTGWCRAFSLCFARPKWSSRSTSHSSSKFSACLGVLIHQASSSTIHFLGLANVEAQACAILQLARGFPAMLVCMSAFATISEHNKPLLELKGEMNGKRAEIWSWVFRPARLKRLTLHASWSEMIRSFRFNSK